MNEHGVKLVPQLLPHNMMLLLYGQGINNWDSSKIVTKCLKPKPLHLFVGVASWQWPDLEAWWAQSNGDIHLIACSLSNASLSLSTLFIR
jgi:hypothetical protein